MATPYQYGQPRMNMYSQSLLPPLKAQAFNGKKARYSEFKTVFDLTIGSNEHAHPVQKLLYLRDLLPAQDQMAVSEYPFSESGYAMVWEYLDAKYGNTESLIYELNRQFANLKVDSHSVQGNMQLWLEAKAVAHQLRSQGAFEQASFIRELMIKFDPDIICMIQRKLTLSTSRNWTVFSEVVTKVLQKLSEQDLLEEELMTNRYQSYAEQDPLTRQSQSDVGKHRTNPNMTNTKMCIYCKAVDSHYSADCDVTPMARRKEFLRNNGRCETCTARGHNSGSCNSNVTCSRCGGRHHRSLPCPSSLDVKVKQGAANTVPYSNQYTQNAQRGANAHNGQLATTMLNIIQNSDKGQRTKSDMEVQGNSHSLHHNLPILYCKVAGKHETVPVLLDCGAQVSLVDNSLATELKLPVARTTKLNLQGFQSGGEVAIVSKVVQLVLEGPKGFRLPVNMHTMEIPIGDVELPNLPSEDRKFLRRKKFRIPKHNTEHRVQPAIILGVDVLWKVLDGLKTKYLPSGNVFVMTKLGSLVTGPNVRHPIEESDADKCKLARQCVITLNNDNGIVTSSNPFLSESNGSFIATDQRRREGINEKIRSKDPKFGAFKDKERAGRCRGRLRNSQSPSSEQGHPMLISSPHSRLVIMNYHNGMNHIMTKVREKFWNPRSGTQMSCTMRKNPLEKTRPPGIIEPAGDASAKQHLVTCGSVLRRMETWKEESSKNDQIRQNSHEKYVDRRLDRLDRVLDEMTVSKLKKEVETYHHKSEFERTKNILLRDAELTDTKKDHKKYRLRNSREQPRLQKEPRTHGSAKARSFKRSHS